MAIIPISNLRAWGSYQMIIEDYAGCVPLSCKE